MKEKLRLYIENNLELQRERFSKARVAPPTVYSEMCYEASIGNVDDFINQNKEDNKFQKLLFKLIDERDLKDSDVYNKVNIDRRLFSKIRSDVDYHPTKETVIKLGLSLELNEDGMEELLSSASYALPKNNVFDLIIRFCLIEKIYDINKVNELLFDYGCNLL